MSRSGVRHTSGVVRIAWIVIAAVSLAGARTARATLRPARPEAGVVKVRLENASSVPAAIPEQRSRAPRYFFVQPGDTLVYRTEGGGKLRIRSRPVFRADQNNDHFRFSVQLDDARRRNFKRRSSLAGQVRVVPVGTERPLPAGAVPADRVLIGQENKLDLHLPAGSHRVRIWMNARDGRGAFVRVLVGDGIAQPHLRKLRSGRRAKFRPSQELHKQIQAASGGYDSNVYLAPKVDEAASGAFWPVAANLEYRARPAPRMEIEARYAFGGRFHRDAILDETRHSLSFEQRLRLGSMGAIRRLTLSFQERLRRRNSTFFGRGDSEEFETISDGEAVSLADRFDYGDLRLSSATSVDVGNRVRVSGRAAHLVRDYREDYEEFPQVYSLDYGRWDFDFGVRVKLAEGLALHGTSSYGFKSYAEKFSRDLDGNEVAAEPTSLFKRRLGMEVQYRQRVGLQLDLGYEDLQSNDRYADYWSYTGTAVTGGVGWRWGGGHEIHASHKYQTIAYENAHVAYGPTQPLREKRGSRVELGARYRVKPWAELQADVRYQDQDNNSEQYAYTRWVFTNGVMLRY